MQEEQRGPMRSLNLKQPLHGISVDKEQRTIAVACKNDLQLLSLRPAGLSVTSSITMSRSSKSADGFVLSDISWSYAARECFAVSATNGDIAVMHLSSPSANQVWGAGESTRAVNRVSWHRFEPHTLASAHQDGLIKLWDCRQKQAAALFKSYQPRADAGRDVQFDPFHDNIVAATFEGGNLVLWDRRMAEQSLLKISAHINSVQSLAWNPCKEWQLATGGRDMSIKVWDFRNGATAQIDDANSGLPCTPSNLPLSLKPAWQLTTPAVVGRIAWRGLALHPDQIGSISVTERSDVSIWKLGFNNIPACVVRGQLENICVGFAWLDTPQLIESVASTEQHQSMGKDVLASASREENRYSGSGENEHVITISKDGLVEIQDIRNGDFPRQRMSRNITTISPRGHVAFQRSDVIKYDILGLNVQLKNTNEGVQHWWDPNPVKFGMTFDESTDNIYASTEVDIGEDIERGGTIAVGLSRISDLQAAHKISTTGAAEGGAFDPAIISLLASSYVLGEFGTKGNQSHAQGFLWAIEALEFNHRIAFDAGLNGHASILSSVASLIRLLNRSEAMNKPGIPLGNNMILFSAVAVEDPFRLLALSSLRDLLSELLDSGDCQHFVVCFEILRRNGLLVGICESFQPIQSSSVASAADATPANRATSGVNNDDISNRAVATPPLVSSPSRLLSALRVREAYLAYIDILSRLGLFTAANDLIKSSEDPYISELSKKGIRLKVGCAKCGKEVSADQISGVDVTAITSIFCGKCQRSAGRCVLCHKPVLGLFKWCPICSHGGHKECIEQWFRAESIKLNSTENPLRGLKIWKKMASAPPDAKEVPSTSSRRQVAGRSGFICCPSGCGHHCFSIPGDRTSSDASN